MQHEMDSLEKNSTWDLVPRLTKKNVDKCRWVYQTKLTLDDVIERNKACFLAKIFFLQEAIDYKETFSSISKMNSIRLILSLASHFGFLIHKMDVKSSFLHGNLVEKIYMEQPPSFIIDYTLVR